MIFSSYKRFKNRKALPENVMHDDVFIVEYPKSGITYLSFLLGNVELIRSGLSDEMTFYNSHKYVPDVHQLKGAMVNRLLDVTYIKSHGLFNPFYYFVFYLIRHPTDVMVSYYNFMLDSGIDVGFEDFVRSQKYGIAAWKRHVNSWCYLKNTAQRIQFIRYEDLVDSPVDVLGRLYKNMGIGVERDVLEVAVDRSSVHKMKVSEDLYASANVNYTMNFVGKSGKLKKSEIVSEDIDMLIRESAKEELEKFYG